MSRLVLSLVVLGVLGGTAAGAAGQETPSLGSDGEVGATASAGLGITWLGSRPLPVYSVAGTLRLSPTVELGGEGIVGFRSVPFSGDGADPESELTFGYGGMLFRWRPAADLPGVRWGASLLLGAGTARVRSFAAGGTSSSANHFVLEPRVNASIRQLSRFRVLAVAGYRIALGAGALPGVGITDLRGPTVSLVGQIVVGP